jgi:hypothetical protein
VGVRSVDILLAPLAVSPKFHVIDVIPGIRIVENVTDSLAQSPSCKMPDSR